MPLQPSAALAACFAFMVVHGLSGCAKRCPDGSGVLNGQCVPVQQTAGQGATGEQGQGSAANTAAGQAAPAVSNGTNASDKPEASANERASSSSAGAGGRANQANPASQSADAGADPGVAPSVECSPADELCDNMDNDCDGKIDEEVTRACQDLPAPCQAGILRCHAGEWDDPAMQCEGAIGPGEEVCDDTMMDEDCNGVANEGCACNEGETRECGRAEGICKPGVQRCSGGMWTMECEGAVGNPDEGCECMSGTSETCSAGRGVCAMGERQCEAGMWSQCTPLESSSTEVCDNLDNDCNGVVDGPTATCGNPDEKCVAPGRCAECTTDRDCAKLTAGCDVGKCQSGKCEPQPLEEFTACTSGSTRGYCVESACTAPRSYKIEDGDIGRGKDQVEYLGGSWSMAGDVRYSNAAGAYFLGHFVGERVAVYGGKNVDRGIVEYSICDARGSACSPGVRVDNYHGSLLPNQLLWTSPRVPFGEHTVRGRAAGKRAEATDAIIDLDYINVN